jgi:hypothetical protein
MKHGLHIFKGYIPGWDTSWLACKTSGISPVVTAGPPSMRSEACAGIHSLVSPIADCVSESIICVNPSREGGSDGSIGGRTSSTSASVDAEGGFVSTSDNFALLSTSLGLLGGREPGKPEMWCETRV